MHQEKLTEAEQLIQQGNFLEAEKYLKKFVIQDPKNSIALRLLGDIYFNKNSFSQAIDYLHQSLALNPEDQKALNLTGLCYKNLYQYKEAAEYFEKAIQLHSKYAAAHSNLIGVLERSNNLSKARLALEKAKTQCPDSDLFTIHEATLLRREKKYKEALSVLENNKIPQDPTSQLLCHHEEATLHDKLQNYEQATIKFNKFNDLATTIYQINDDKKSIYLKKIDNNLEIYNSNFVKTWPSSGERNDNDSIVKAFLFGFARSGTTLYQHILSAHPDIHSTEEIHAIPRIVEILETQVGDYPNCLKSLPSNQVQQLQNLYHQIHRSDHDWKEKKVLVDKYPFGTINIGISHFLFPKAKFIFAARHPYDCILSSYFQFFVPNEGMIHTYSLENTVNLYCKLMDLWRRYIEVLEIEHITIKYEDVVNDMPLQIKRIIEFLGLEYDSTIVNYQDHVLKRGNIRTPSYAQVSENIYHSSQYRWKNYEALIAPHRTKLQPYLDWLDYPSKK